MTTTLAPEIGPEGAARAPAEPVPAPSARTQRWTIRLYATASFTSSALLFLVELLAARLLLPELGGTSSVWNTSMVFFQLVLLAGYAWAHLATTRLGARTHRFTQVTLLLAGITALPIALPVGWDPVGVDAAIWVVMALTVAVGLPFLALSTVGPTLQAWYSNSGHDRAADPYFLYASGNAGSLVALLAYPTVVEPRLDLADQASTWSIGYGALIVLIALCALTRRGAAAPVRTESDVADASAAPSWSTRLRWMGIAALPSALLLGLTRHVSTDLASIPLFWIVPLALYLVSFIVAFGRRSERWVAMTGRSVRLLAIVVILLGPTKLPLVAQVLPHVAFFLAASIFLHGRLAAERPAARHLTVFYLCLSTGGVVGGALTSLVAPLVFPLVAEYPLAVALAALLAPAAGPVREASRGVSARTVFGAGAFLAAAGVATAMGIAEVDRPLVMCVFGVMAAVGYVTVHSSRAFVGVLLLVVAPLFVIDLVTPLTVERTFFGVSRVYEADGVHYLQSGTTVHGAQDFDGGPSLLPRTYYAPDEGIGRWFTGRPTDGPALDVGVIGLGSGALAGYGRAGDTFDFYEIDPAVIQIASDPDLFTYLTDSPATVSTIEGDGRLQLERSDTRYDVVVLDAFSSDSIPVHLLTAEAFEVYGAHLVDGGVLAVHISNRFFDLRPVVAGAADHLGLDAWMYQGPSATWVLMTSEPDRIAAIADDPGLTPLVSDDPTLWSDDYSDLVGTLRW